MTSHDEQLKQVVKPLTTLHQNLRTVRHAIDNDIAVLLAMAELSQRHLTHPTKLSQICLDKLPKIAAAIGEFAELFDGTLRLQRELAARATLPTTPPPPKPDAV